MKKAIIQLLLIMGGFATADELPINHPVGDWWTPKPFKQFHAPTVGR
jgi:hypothetical protein